MRSELGRVVAEQFTTAVFAIEELASSADDLRPSAAMENQRLTVVYADDDDLVRETISTLLTDEGLDVHACESVAEAIVLCEQMDPDAVLLDLNMPEVDGLTAARELRRKPENSTLRIVALTGSCTGDLRRKAQEAGFDEFLTKPVATAVLVRALRAE